MTTGCSKQCKDAAGHAGGARRGQIAALADRGKPGSSLPISPKPYKDWRLETRQLLNATIRSREIWSPTQQCGGVSEPAADVDVGENYLANHFGRHPAPLGDLLLLPTRADRTFGWPSSTDELF